MQIAIGFFAVAILTYVLKLAILRFGILDVPNERSSHDQPTPRGGGLSIVITFIAFLAANFWFGYIPVENSLVTALIIGGVLVAAIGIADDIKGVSARLRISTHLAAVTVSLWIVGTLPAIHVLGLELKSQFALFVLLGLSLVWFINLFNFMDGIDGIAGAEVITASTAGALIMTTNGVDDWSMLLGFLVACTAGFLIWNWSPAKVFMGDSCSGFLGFTLGLLAIVTSLTGAISLWSWLILFGVFVVDSTVTLITRISRGDKWYTAHRSHAYQILSRRLQSHHKVVIAVMIINVIWLAPIAYLATVYSFWAFPFCLLALTPLVTFSVVIGAGRPEPVVQI